MSVTARRAAAERVARLTGLDLAGWLADGRDVRPQQSHVDGPAWAELDVPGALTRYLTRHDLGLRGDPQQLHRLVWTRDGVDRDQVPDAPLVRPREAVGHPLRVVAAAVPGALAAGASLKARRLELASVALAAVVDDVQEVTGLTSTLLAYLSGAGATGWGAHYDRHDGVVVQVLGSKRWRVFQPVEPYPTRPHTPYAVTGDLALEVILGPGDVLAVPRGWGHEVLGTDEPSLHLTMPLRPPVAGDLLRAALGPAEGRAGLEVAPISAGRWAAQQRYAVRIRQPGSLVALDDVRRRIELAAHGTDIDWSGCQSHVRAAHPWRRPPDLDAATAPMYAAIVDGGSLPVGVMAHTVEAGRALLRLLDLDAVRVLRPTDRPGDASTTSVVCRSGPAASQGVASFRAGLPTGPVLRALDDRDPDEHRLAAALRARRHRATTRLRALIPALDLPGLLAAPRSAVPAAARLDVSRLPVEPLLAAVDDVLATRDVGAGRASIAHGGIALNRPLPDEVVLAADDPNEPLRVDIARLYGLLVEGATSILFGIDDSDPLLSGMAGLVEEVAQVRSGINAYLSHGSFPSGFGPHWDDHDVLVLQLQGAKRWDVFEPSEPFPTRGWTPDAPSDRLALSRTLRAGDVLFVPRGWGHDVHGTGGLSVHLTFPLRAALGAEVLTEALVPGPLPTLVGADRAVASARCRWAARIPARRLGDDMWVEASRARARLAVPGGVAVVDPAPVGDTEVALAMAAGVLTLPRRLVGDLAPLLSDQGAPSGSVDPGLLAALVDAGLVDLVPEPSHQST